MNLELSELPFEVWLFAILVLAGIVKMGQDGVLLDYILRTIVGILFFWVLPKYILPFVGKIYHRILEQSLSFLGPLVFNSRVFINLLLLFFSSLSLGFIYYAQKKSKGQSSETSVFLGLSVAIYIFFLLSYVYSIFWTNFFRYDLENIWFLVKVLIHLIIIVLPVIIFHLAGNGLFKFYSKNKRKIRMNLLKARIKKTLEQEENTYKNFKANQGSQFDL